MERFAWHAVLCPGKKEEYIKRHDEIWPELKALLKEQPLSKISIGEICDLCSMSRKSFYYHFKDKEDLISWIFDTEFEEACKEKTRVIDTLIKYFYENKSFYKKVLKENTAGRE